MREYFKYVYATPLAVCFRVVGIHSGCSEVILKLSVPMVVMSISDRFNSKTN